MKALKIYLMSMGVLLTLALLAGIVVWYLYQDLPGANPKTLITETLQREAVVSSEPTPSSGVASTTEPISEEEAEPVYTITPDSLTPSQRALLSTFGVEDSSLAVTEAMIVCAKDAVGEARFGEILEGSAPGPLESLSLLPCMKK